MASRVVKAVGRARPVKPERASRGVAPAKPKTFQEAMREAVDAELAKGTRDRLILHGVAAKAKTDFLAAQARK
jgi:hypothetical protein